jgi:hypothetical protein
VNEIKGGDEAKLPKSIRKEKLKEQKAKLEGNLEWCP